MTFAAVIDVAHHPISIINSSGDILSDYFEMNILHSTGKGDEIKTWDLFSYSAKHGLLACMGLHICCGIYPECFSNKNVCTAGHP
jgi:hypothetical protein